MITCDRTVFGVLNTRSVIMKKGRVSYLLVGIIGLNTGPYIDDSTNALSSFAMIVLEYAAPFYATLHSSFTDLCWLLHCKVNSVLVEPFYVLL